MKKRAPLSEAKVKEFVATHKDWNVEEGALVRTYEAPDFLRGITFVQQIAKVAEAANHHPDIDIRWTKVTLSFITHDAGDKITALDTRLAAECDLVFDAL